MDINKKRQGRKQSDVRQKEKRNVREEQTQTLLLKVYMRDWVCPSGPDLRLHPDVSLHPQSKFGFMKQRARSFVNSVTRDGSAQLTCAGDIKADFKVKE